ncbi:MAG: hypothetical protein GQ565_04245 [Candidatus Aegiribacteria sp.]|nr:hypothetical protein [Candidatus Aegiribacteria sp.]
MYCSRCGQKLPENTTAFCTFCGKALSEKHNQTSNKFISYVNLGSGFKVTIISVSIDETARNVANIFFEEGYQLDSGTPVNGVYATGSSLCRFLLGGFAKRYKFNINIYSNAQNTTLVFSSGMTGFSGGLLGVSRMKTETERIMNIFKHKLRRRI